ncbi:hypothetical protein SAMN04489707_10679 [Paenacidovorax caeni]|uniref:Uncharacterized protein n=1 Tax=Paenacidovorax caeni TaxID=343013 RepID=A0A1I7KRK3_9BURK|nr:hypothetical protein [Paenacidovorax caeni]SFV00006.1 hypothetical protein SAMN04489707_10679 [Paenacidovorax caeni]
MSTDSTTTCASAPHWEAYGYLRNISGAVIAEHGHAELRQALQGAAAVAALFMQRELDTEQGAENPLTFSPGAAVGLLAALASCINHAADIAHTGGIDGAHAAPGTPAYRVLEGAAQEIRSSRAQARAGAACSP